MDHSLVFQNISEPVSIIAPVGESLLCLRQAALHGRRSGEIAAWTSANEHADRAALSISYDVMRVSTYIRFQRFQRL